MFALPSASFGRLLPRYLAESAFFPLISAVLEGSQDGMVLVDDPLDTRQAFVAHAFGFAQIFGERAPRFEIALADYLTERRAFQTSKLRLYTPLLPAFLLRSVLEGFRSERQRFVLDAERITGTAPEAEAATWDDIPEIRDRFGIVTRFWRSAEDFMMASRAHVVRRSGQIAAVCYAAAIGGGKAEIDVVTDPAFRRQGLGRQATIGFLTACRQAGLEPVWDCFTNNLPSVRTALSLGFSAKGSPYLFFTIPRT